MTSDVGSSKPRRLKVYPQRFVLVSLKREQLSGCALGLLKLILYPEHKNRFFSFTDASSEISLVLEDTALSLFESDTFQHTSQRWRAIQFDEGPLGFESTGIVNSVALPLSKAGINIYYVSTYNSGHTLVEEDLIDSAIDCLKSAGFTFSNANGVTSPQQSTAIKEVHYEGNLGSSTGSSASSGSIGKSYKSKQAACSMVITKLPYQIYITSLSKDRIGPLAEHLLKLFFFPARENRFFSFTETPDEVSIMLDMASAELLPSVTQSGIVWRVLQISQGAYGSHGTETVSKFAKPLADAHISIMNVSTYMNDYTLVEESDMDKSLEELKKNINVIIDEFEADE